MKREDFKEEEIARTGHIMDSKTSHLDDVLQDKLEKAFNKETSLVLLSDVIKIASEHDPIDLAFAVTKLPAYVRTIVYENLPDMASKSTFMIHAGKGTRSVIFREISDQEVAALVEQIPSDEAVSLLEDLSARRLKRISTYIDPEKMHRISDLQRHERHTAGRLMNNEFFSFPMNTTIKEISKEILDNPGVDIARGIFVTAPEGNLVGYVPTRNLLVNKENVEVKKIMRPVLHTVLAEASRDEVVDLVERYQIPFLPVVDKQSCLLGVIDYRDVVEIMEDIADDTIANIAGTGESVGEHEPLLKRYFWRIPFLLVTLCAGLFTSTAMSHFNTYIWFAFLPFFVPLIAGMSGNVGLQCSAILVRSMSIGEISSRTRKDAIIKELGIGSLIGITFGLFCGLMVYLLTSYGIHSLGANPLALAVTVACGLFGACLTATVLGTFSPFFFVRMNIDPAVASGPIVTAFNDVLSTLMFFLIGRILYPLFG
jgi:magnesium transporter